MGTKCRTNRKTIEVIKAFYHIDEETIFLENALFKIESSLLLMKNKFRI
jgi:acetolactate synthase-1/3 small subunit